MLSHNRWGSGPTHASAARCVREKEADRRATRGERYAAAEEAEDEEDNPMNVTEST